MNRSTIWLHAGLERAILSLTICAAVISAAAAAPQSEKRQILRRAQQRYYNLKRSGLVEFRANIKPNWEVVLMGVGTNPSAMKLINGLRFSMSIDSESKFRMEHHADITPPNRKSLEGFDNIFKGMDEAVSGFVATWSIFMLTSPFPGIESNYDVKEVAGQYRFSVREGATDVLTITDKDFMIIEIQVSGEGFKASLKPVLEDTANGFILRGYAASYTTPSGTRNTQVTVQLDYEEISGLHLPRKANLDTVYEGKPAQIEWLFTDYQVKVR